MECGKAENLSKTQISFKPRNQLPHSTIAAVNDFYLDEKISRQMPGRKDTISVKQPSGTRVKLRKHLLSYTTSDAYEIFKTEHPEIKIGLSKFKELRPANCIPTSRHDQIVCACKYCENAELTLSALRLAGVCSIDMPSTIHQLLKLTTCDMENEQCVKRECSSCSVDVINGLVTQSKDSVDVYQWREGDNGYLNKLCDMMSSEAATDLLKSQLSSLSLHMYTSNKQHEAIRKLKANLKDGEILIHEDFSENFACKQNTEIQSAYYNTIGVTVFTVMIYFKQNGDLQHRCCVVVSDNMEHSKDSVYAFNKEIIQYARSEIGLVNHIHFVSDGAASQFKNRFTVQNLKHSQTDFGVSADWSYFETSHGKGAVDGVGGTIKQQVLLAVYRGQAVVNSAQTFADTAKRLTEKSAKPIKVIYVSSEEITQSSKLCQDRWMQAPPAPGIRKCHFIYIKDNTPCLLELTPTEVR